MGSSTQLLGKTSKVPFPFSSSSRNFFLISAIRPLVRSGNYKGRRDVKWGSDCKHKQSPFLHSGACVSRIFFGFI